MQLAKENLPLMQRISKRLTAVTDIIRGRLEALGVRKGSDGAELKPEIKALKDEAEKLDNIRNLFMEGYKQASETFKAQNSQKDAGNGQKNNADVAVKYSVKENEFDITFKDIEELRKIPKKSVTELTSEEVTITQKWARKFYKEIGKKSPFFRAWFGDWRENDKQKLTKVIVNTKKIDVSDVPRTGTKNLDTGWDISVSGKGIDKTANAHGKWSLEYHSLSTINSMLENAVLLETVVVGNPSKKLGQNVAFLHHMYVPIVADGKDMVAKLYVTEEIGNEHKFYLIKTEAVSAKSRRDSDKASRQLSSDKTASINTVADLFAFVKERTADFESDSDNPILFKPKKVGILTNSDGTPQIVYHGSPQKFTVFEYSKMNTNGNAHGRGFYFTEDKTMAEGYQREGGQLLEGYLNIKNPMSEEKVTIKKPDLVKLIKATCEAEAKEMVDDGEYDNVSDALPDTWISNYVYTYGMSLNEAYREVADIIYSSAESDVEIIAEITNVTDTGNVLENVHKTTGYDGVIYTNERGTHEYVALTSNQFKSVDNIGTFDGNNPDINYSTKDTSPIQAHYAEVLRENNNLRQIISALDEMNYSSARKEFTLNSRDIFGIASKLIKQTSSKYDKKTLADELTVLYDYMANNKGTADSEEILMRFIFQSIILLICFVKNSI